MCIRDSLFTVTSDESGGSSTGQGMVSVDECTAVLSEGDSFVVALEAAFTVPAVPSAIQFRYSSLAFDATDPTFINDAFEVALLDPDGNSLVESYTPGRDAYFNITEDSATATSVGVIVDGHTISVGLNGLPAGTEATVVFRLVNNDSDTNSTVRLADFRLVDSDLRATSAGGPSSQLHGVTSQLPNMLPQATLSLIHISEPTRPY